MIGRWTSLDDHTVSDSGPRDDAQQVSMTLSLPPTTSDCRGLLCSTNLPPPPHQPTSHQRRQTIARPQGPSAAPTGSIAAYSRRC